MNPCAAGATSLALLPKRAVSTLNPISAGDNDMDANESRDPYREFYDETGRMLDKWSQQDREWGHLVLGFWLGVILTTLLWIVL